MTGMHPQVTPVDLLHLSPKNDQNENLLLGLDPGECILLEQLDNRLDPPHVAPEEPGTTRLVSTILRMNPNKQTAKDVT